MNFLINKTTLEAISEPNGWNGHVESVKNRIRCNGFDVTAERIKYVLELQNFRVYFE